jgi:quercetin dioxygenase-like cupin family protein
MLRRVQGVLVSFYYWVKACFVHEEHWMADDTWRWLFDDPYTHTRVRNVNLETPGDWSVVAMLVMDDAIIPPHRHDHKEEYYIIRGEGDLMFRGHVYPYKAGSYITIPRLALHWGRFSKGTLALQVFSQRNSKVLDDPEMLFDAITNIPDTSSITR